MNNTTKGGEYLIKETKPEDIFTKEDFSQEQLMMQESVTEFIDREVWPHKNRFESKDFAFTQELMKKAGELGFLSVSIPEKFGGMGMDFVSTLLVCDYISGATGSFSSAFGAHTGIGTMPILLYGTKQQKQKYLNKLATGELIGCYCLTEPDSGSDANSGKTKAVLSEDKKHYLISGQKMWITNGGYADVMIVFARIDQDKNITAFIVDKDIKNGITLGEEEHKLGIRASSTRQVFFSKTKVPVENMLSERGKGFKIALNSLNIGRIKLSAACLDASRRIVTNSVIYANQRKQFNTPIAQFGAIKHKLAQMASYLYCCDAATYRAGYSIQKQINFFNNQGEEPQEAELKGVEEYAIECAILKVYASEMIQFISDQGIQIFGGMGFSEDTPMESAYRDARITRIYEGTNEINRLLSVGMLLKKALKGNIDLITPAKSVAKELISIPSFEKPDYNKLFSQEKVIIANLKKAFFMITGKAIETFGSEFEKEQQLMLNSADIMMHIYMSESALLKTERLVAKKGEKECKHIIAITELSLFNSVEKIIQKGRESIVSFTKNDEQRMLLIGLKRFTKYYNYPNVIELRRIIADKLIAENKFCF